MLVRKPDMVCEWYINAPPACIGELLSAGASVTVTAGHTLVVDACASETQPPATWDGPLATCGDAGFWAATGVAGVHTVPAGATAKLVNESLPPLLRPADQRGGRSTLGASVSLGVCVPSTTPATYIANLAPSALQLVTLAAGRAITVISTTASDVAIAASMASYGDNATLLFRSGAHPAPPAAVTLFWANPTPAAPPQLSQLMPALTTQVKWTTSSTQRAWYMTFHDVGGSADAAADAASTFLAAINASVMGHVMVVSRPPPASAPQNSASIVSNNVLPFVSLITATCILIGTVVGVLTFIMNRRKSPLSKFIQKEPEAAVQPSVLKIR